MLLINQKPLEVGIIKDKDHPLFQHALEYDKGIKYLKSAYVDKIRFVRPGFPKFTSGFDSRGRPKARIALPTTPMIIPLQAEFAGSAGLEIWACALDNPKLLPNNLWELGNKRSLMIKDASYTVDLHRQAELAFFLYYKSPFFRSGLLKIVDPVADAKAEGDKQRNELKLQTAIYGVLDDIEQLKIVAQAKGVSDVDKKHPDMIRKQLKDIIVKAEANKKRNPLSSGIAEFLEDMKITDAVRLRSVIKSAEDRGMIVWKEDGRYLIGERVLCKVPVSDLSTKFEYLCNHLNNIRNREKLQDLLGDIVTKDFLDNISDNKTFTWLGRVFELDIEFKDEDVVKDMVYSEILQLDEGEIVVKEVTPPDETVQKEEEVSVEEDKPVATPKATPRKRRKKRITVKKVVKSE